MELITNVVDEQKLRAAQLRALKLFADALKCTYGPMGGYTLWSLQDVSQKNKVIVSNYTKDGLQVLKRVDCDKPIESILKEEIRTICTNVVKKIGDGTTSATILSYYIFKGLLKLHKKGFKKREIITTLKDILAQGSANIKENGHECTLDDIYKIALTSTDGNEDIAKIIKDIYEESGMNVFIDVGMSSNDKTVVKTYNSMVYEAGYLDPAFANTTLDAKNEEDAFKGASACELISPHVYVFESPIDTPAMIDTVKLIFEKEIIEPTKRANKLYNENKAVEPEDRPNAVVIISPKISRDANSYIDELIVSYTQLAPSQRPKFCMVTNLENDNQYLTDIAKLTGARFIKKYIDPVTYKMDKKNGLAIREDGSNVLAFAGKAEKVIVDATTTRIINPLFMYDEDGNYTDFFNEYIAQLKDLLRTYEETHEEIGKIGRLKRRINILQSNMVDLYVGGIGTSDRVPLTDSVEDAVLNCRSAAAEGVGYGANYEGLRVFNAMDIQFQKNFAENPDSERDKIYALVSSVVIRAYWKLVAAIYEPYFENEEKALNLVRFMIAAEDHKYRQPFNIVTEEFDGCVLTSIQTEPAILDSISRIVTILFNTNQFVLPDPRFNIYKDMDTSIYDNILEDDISIEVDKSKAIYEENNEIVPESVPVDQITGPSPQIEVSDI